MPDNDPAKTDPAGTLKWALRRMDWYTLSRLTDALETLGADAIKTLRDLVEAKHERAR